jgi:hypothetical protein
LETDGVTVGGACGTGFNVDRGLSGDVSGSANHGDTGGCGGNAYLNAPFFGRDVSISTRLTRDGSGYNLSSGGEHYEHDRPTGGIEAECTQTFEF